MFLKLILFMFGLFVGYILGAVLTRNSILEEVEDILIKARKRGDIK